MTPVTPAPTDLGYEDAPDLCDDGNDEGENNILPTREAATSDVMGPSVPPAQMHATPSLPMHSHSYRARGMPPSDLSPSLNGNPNSQPHYNWPAFVPAPEFGGFPPTAQYSFSAHPGTIAPVYCHSAGDENRAVFGYDADVAGPASFQD